MLPFLAGQTAIRRSASLMAFALMVGACQDSTTGPALLPGDSTRPTFGQATPYFCTTQTLTPAGTVAGEIPLVFPREARSADGSTMAYRFRRQTPSGVVTYAADCIIPRTVPAVEQMNRRFQLPPRTGLPVGGGRPEEEVTILSECSADPTQGCTIIAEPPPMRKECDPMVDPECMESGGGGTTPSPGTGGGGTGYTPPSSPGNDVPQDPSLPDCAQPHNTMEQGWCTGWGPDGEFLKRVNDALHRMDQRGQECKELADQARALIGNNSFRFTDTSYPGWTAAAPLNGKWAIFHRVWVDQWGTDGQSLDYIISHEMDHSLGHVVAGVTNSDGHLLKPDGTVDPHWTINARKCAGVQ